MFSHLGSHWFLSLIAILVIYCFVRECTAAPCARPLGMPTSGVWLPAELREAALGSILNATAPQEGPAAEGADDDVLKQPAQRVPFDGANGATPEDDPEDHDAGAAYDDGDEEADSGSGRLAPATPDLDEELQQSATAAAAAGYVSRENRTPYMERKIRELRVRVLLAVTRARRDLTLTQQPIWRIIARLCVRNIWTNATCHCTCCLGTECAHSSHSCLIDPCRIHTCSCATQYAQLQVNLRRPTTASRRPTVQLT